MQRIGMLLVGLSTLGSARLGAQAATGTTLWRVAATTLATPPALAQGAAATIWNPAQTQDSARLQLALEAIQTPSAINATGMIGTIRIPAGRIGHLGLVYGRVGLSDIAQTIDSPDPTGSAVPVYTFAVGANWSRSLSGTDVGATVAFHETRLDEENDDRWTLDIGASRSFSSDRFRIAAATHFFSSFTANDPAQDVFAGVEARIWTGPVSERGDRTVVRGRYGISFAHGFTADHQLGVGAELSKIVNIDVLFAHEGGYSGGSWRPVVGLGLAIGKYRIGLARDGGVSDLGSAYRVGVEARFK
ncbi:MAG TPA: hypothetical protein VN513_07120 [Gemmatimonadales bacterium]|nr:hypothetical protein [Gemmatimonadales bacterium]